MSRRHQFVDLVDTAHRPAPAAPTVTSPATVVVGEHEHAQRLRAAVHRVQVHRQLRAGWWGPRPWAEIHERLCYQTRRAARLLRDQFDGDDSYREALAAVGLNWQSVGDASTPKEINAR